MKGKKIGCSNGKIYLSAYEASVDTGARRNSVISVCIGDYKTTSGFKFWYIKGE